MPQRWKKPLTRIDLLQKPARKQGRYQVLPVSPLLSRGLPQKFMIEPVQIIEESDSEISIKWSDGSESVYTASALRRACPCAGCVDEWTGKKTLQDAQVAEDISFKHTSIVGRYALNFHFSDGHDTGIFSFKYLQDLSVPPAVAGG